MLGVGSLADFAVASFSRTGTITTLSLSAGALTLSGKTATFSLTQLFAKGSLHLTGRDIPNYRVIVDHGALTLNGKPIVLTSTLPEAKGDLTLTGRSISFMLTDAVTQGALHLTGKSIVTSTTLPLFKASLTLTGKAASFMTTLPLAKGALLLTGYDLPVYRLIVEAGQLTLNGQSIITMDTMVVEPGRLRLFARDIGLTQIGGGGDPRRKRRTGFEPVTKRPRVPIEPPKNTVLMPPPQYVRPVHSIVPDDTSPLDLVDQGLLPPEPTSIMHEVYSAQDMSDVAQFMRLLDQDEQDAADIADVLALLD